MHRVLLTLGLLGGVGLVPGVAQPGTVLAETGSVVGVETIKEPIEGTRFFPLEARTTLWGTVSGNVRFSRDRSRIEAIADAPDSYVIVEERHGLERRKVRVTSGRNPENLVYRYIVQGTPRTLDEKARAWYEAALKEVVLEPLAGTTQTPTRGSEDYANKRYTSSVNANLLHHVFTDAPSQRVREGGSQPTPSDLFTNITQATHYKAHNLISDLELEEFLLDIVRNFNPDRAIFREVLYASRELADENKVRFLETVAPHLLRDEALTAVYHDVSATITASRLRLQAVSALKAP